MDKDDNKETLQFLSVRLNNQTFGVPIEEIQDVLKDLPITDIPMAKSYIKGVSNLRGRIVTAIDLQKRMYEIGAAEDNDTFEKMNIVVENNDELYSILVDKVGDVVEIPKDEVEAPPITLDPKWQELCQGVHKLDGDLMIIINTDKIIKTKQDDAEKNNPIS